MGDFEYDVDLLISLVKARPVLWDKTDDIYKDKRNEKGMERRLRSSRFKKKKKRPLLNSAIIY